MSSIDSSTIDKRDEEKNIFFSKIYIRTTAHKNSISQLYRCRRQVATACNRSRNVTNADACSADAFQSRIDKVANDASAVAVAVDATLFESAAIEVGCDVIGGAMFACCVDGDIATLIIEADDDDALFVVAFAFNIVVDVDEVECSGVETGVSGHCND